MANVREDLHELNTEIAAKVRVMAMKRAAIDQVVAYFCKVLKYVGEFWEMNHAWMEKIEYNDSNDMETKILEKMVEAISAALDGLIRTGNSNVARGKDGNKDRGARISMYEKSVTGPQLYPGRHGNALHLSFQVLSYIAIEATSNIELDSDMARVLPSETKGSLSADGLQENPRMSSSAMNPCIPPIPLPAPPPPPFSKLSLQKAGQESPTPASQGRQPIIASPPPPTASPPLPFSKLSSKGAAQESACPAPQGRQTVIAPPPPAPPPPPPPLFSKLSSKGAVQESAAPAPQGRQTIRASPPPAPPPPPFSKLSSKGTAQDSPALTSQGRQPVIALPPPYPPPAPPPPPHTKVSSPLSMKVTPSVQAEESMSRLPTRPNAPKAVTTPKPPPAPPKSTPSLATKGQPQPPPPPVPKNPGTTSLAWTPPPPPPVPSAKAATPPPPPSFSTTRLAHSKKPPTKLKRSTQIANLYRLLKKKMEGSELVDTSNSKRKGQIGGSTGGQAGMAAYIEEMTNRSAYFQQITKDVQVYAKPINVLKAELSSFQNKDMMELINFRNYLESFLEKLTDETQVLARFEGFPTQKLEAVRGSAALYSKLEAFLIDLQKWKVEPPLDKLLNQIESYFNKMKQEVDTFERIKDEELKKFQKQSIHFDLHILARIKEQMVDISSSCMELALKEKREEKRVEECEIGRNAKRQADQKHTKLLWRAFQFAFRVYTFAGGIDERADMLTKHLAHEIQTNPPPK